MQKRTAVLFRRRALITEAWILREYFKRQEEAGIGRERDAAAGLGGIQGTTVHPIQQIAAATATCTRFKALCAMVACVTVWWQYRYIFFRVRKNNVEKNINIINEDEQSFLFTPPPSHFHPNIEHPICNCQWKMHAHLQSTLYSSAVSLHTPLGNHANSNKFHVQILKTVDKLLHTSRSEGAGV